MEIIILGLILLSVVVYFKVNSKNTEPTQNIPYKLEPEEVQEVQEVRKIFEDDSEKQKQIELEINELSKPLVLQKNTEYYQSIVNAIYKNEGGIRPHISIYNELAKVHGFSSWRKMKESIQKQKEI